MNNEKEKKIFKTILDENPVKRPIIKNCIKAFVFGGLICLIGEIIRIILINKLLIDEKNANTIMLIIIIVISAFLTGFGIYDKIGQNAGAGSIIPISGFANSLTSSAIESKSEGFVLGVLTNAICEGKNLPLVDYITEDEKKPSAKKEEKVETVVETPVVEEVKEETADLSKKTVAELREMAKVAGIAGVSAMKKDELIEVLNK